MSGKDKSSSSKSGKDGELKRKVPNRSTKPGKSSTEILTELFGSFDTLFDESDVVNDPSSPTKSRIKSKHSKSKKHGKKDKDSPDSPKKKKKSKRERSRSKEIEVDKEKTSKSVHHKEKSKDSKRIQEIQGTVRVPIPAATEPANNEPPVSKYPTIQFRGKTIVLDIEEGEITEEAERKAERKKHLRKQRELEEDEKRSKKKKRHSGENESERNSSSKYESSSSSQSRRESRKGDSSDSEDYYKSSSRRRDSHRSRSRSHSPSRRSSRDKSDKSSYQAIRWERAHDRSPPDKTYYYNSNNSVRRTSAYNSNDLQKYNGSRGGIGYSGSSSRAEDDYYDYRRDRRGSGRRSRSRSRSNERNRGDRSRSRSYRERSTLRRLHPDDIIDKSVLLDIARKNAGKLMRSGVLPTDIFSRDQILAIKAGGKSVEELTEYCKRIAKRDAMGDANDASDEEHLINHPFQVKDRPMPAITMNIRNSIPLQIRTPHELAIESAKMKIIFPVSSGTQHRHKELEWKSVDDEGEKKETKKEDLTKALLPVGLVAPIPQEVPDTEIAGKGITLEPKPASSVDIGSVISKRIRAMKDLQENPDSLEAKERLDAATFHMKEWAEAKALEPKFLTPAELLTGPQAWAKKDQLKTAAAVQGGMGMHLLQRMGWSPGEGLGKNKEGSTEPLALDIKMDKKGLASQSDLKGPSLPTVFDLTGKHPVSSLMELCAKRRWGNPTFELCFEHGPSHKPNFVYKVTVNGVEYQPCVATQAKKEAKSNAAAFCLQSLGLLPMPKAPAAPAKPTELLKTVPDKGQGSSDTTLMPPPPPPPALQKLLDFPLPPSAIPICDPVPPVSSPQPPLPPPMSQQNQQFGPRRPMLPPHQQEFGGHGGGMAGRLMNLAGIPMMAQQPLPAYDQEYESYLQPPPIVQLPLSSSSSIQGFPGLTTF